MCQLSWTDRGPAMLLKGDCVEVMRSIKDRTVDAIVCDPPYG